MKLDTDRIVSLSAMVVGVGSLFVILYQTQLTRQAQYASVLPYLMIAINSNQEGVYIVLSNGGLGPAMIDDVRVRYQGREIKSDPFDFYQAVRPDSSRWALDVNKVQQGRLIPAGASIQMVGVASSNDPGRAFLSEVLQLFQIAEVPKSWYHNVGAAATEKAIIEVSYSSVYGSALASALRQVRSGTLVGGNREQGTSAGASRRLQGTGNKEQGTSSQVASRRSQVAGNREQGTRNKEQGTRNKLEEGRRTEQEERRKRSNIQGFFRDS